MAAEHLPVLFDMSVMRLKYERASRIGSVSLPCYSPNVPVAVARAIIRLGTCDDHEALRTHRMVCVAQLLLFMFHDVIDVSVIKTHMEEEFGHRDRGGVAAFLAKFSACLEILKADMRHANAASALMQLRVDTRVLCVLPRSNDESLVLSQVPKRCTPST